MLNSLYECFDSWDRGGSIYLYSDPHFNEKDMAYLRHNYIGDEEQVKKINSKIGKKDTLIILGDIGDVSFIKKLRGYKVLILGNHDKGASYYKRKGCKIVSAGEDLQIHFVRDEDNHLFDEVYEGPLIITPKIILSHESVDLPFMFNIHGHNHGGKYKEDDHHLNICAELIDYTPISLNKLIKEGLTKNVEDIHRQTIDRAILRKEAKDRDVATPNFSDDIW